MRALFALVPSCALSCALLAGAFLGCGGLVSTPGDSSADPGSTASPDASPPPHPTTGDAGRDASTDATTTADADVGNPIWPSNAQALIADSPGGGFTPTPPPGSSCAYGKQRYTLQVATGAFSFERCVPGATFSDPLTLVTGARTLTPAEIATIDAAMNALTPPKDVSTCGADKPTYKVTVTTPVSATNYFDSFYACTGGGKLYVDNIDGVFSAFDALVPVK
jgi:hypothetical protein